MESCQINSLPPFNYPENGQPQGIAPTCHNHPFICRYLVLTKQSFVLQHQYALVKSGEIRLDP